MNGVLRHKSMYGVIYELRYVLSPIGGEVFNEALGLRFSWKRSPHI